MIALGIHLGMQSGTGVAPEPSAPSINSVGILPSIGPVGTAFTAFASVSGWPTPARAWQWALDGTPIPGATGASHTSYAPGDLTVSLTASNSEGEDTAESATATVTVPAPVITSAGEISGTGKIGDAHGVVGFAYTGEGAVTYQWLRDGNPILGASGMAYLPAAADDLTTLVRRTTVTNAAGSDSADTPGMAITYAAPSYDGGLTAQEWPEGQTITPYDAGAFFTGGGLTFGQTGLPAGLSLHAATGVITGTPTTEAPAVTVTITAANSGGTASGTFSATISEAPSAPTSVTAPSIASTGKIGSGAAGTPGEWTGADSLAYQWQLFTGDEWADIDGQTAINLSGNILAAWDGDHIRLREAATNAEGTAYAYSDAQAITYNAPVAGAGPFAWTETQGTGSRTYDAKAMFSVAGDPTGASLTFGLTAPSGEAAFQPDVFEPGVFEAGSTSIAISIDPDTGIITLDTSDMAEGVEVTITASNSGGSDSTVLTVTVEAGDFSLNPTGDGAILANLSPLIPFDAVEETGDGAIMTMEP